MRFIVAALAAFFVLMSDFQGSPSSDPGYASTTAAVPVPQEHAFDADSFLARFNTSPESSEDRTAMTADEAAAPASGGAEPSASAIDLFCDTLKQAAEESDIPVAFFARLIWQESRFRLNEISQAGAQGVAQFMPDTAAEVGLDDPFDPLKALPASARLLRKLRDNFGNIGLAAAAYNAGSGRIQKWLARQSDLPRETRDYVRIITGTRAEDWIEDIDTLPIRTDLPHGAPCEGVGGLSLSKDVTFVPAQPAPGVTMIIRKAQAMELAARSLARRSRQRLALLLKKGRLDHAGRGARRHVVIARDRTRIKPRAIRVALREHSSS